MPMQASVQLPIRLPVQSALFRAAKVHSALTIRTSTMPEHLTEGPGTMRDAAAQRSSLSGAARKQMYSIAQQEDAVDVPGASWHAPLHPTGPIPRSPLQVVFCLLHAPVLFADLSPQPSGPILSLACVSMHLRFSALMFLQSQAIVERLFLPLVCQRKHGQPAEPDLFMKSMHFLRPLTTY